MGRAEGLRWRETPAYAWCAKLLVAGLFALALPTFAQTAPAQPTGLVAQAGDGFVVLTWQAAPPQRREEELEGEIITIETPADISRYEVSFAVGGGAFGAWAQYGATATSATVRNLTNDIEHTFRLRAVNATGNGPWAEVTATPTGDSDLDPNVGAPVPETDDGPVFDPDFGDQTGPALVYRVGIPVETALPRAFAATLYGVRPELPDGLSFNAKSAVISGTPTTAQPPTAYTLTARDDDNDRTTLPFTIEVLENSRPSFTGGVADQTYRVGDAIDVLVLPSATGGDGELSYALTPTVPAGLALDAASRSVAGTPTQVSARATYAWTATDADGDTATLTFTIEVLPDTMPRFGASVADQTYRVGDAIDILVLPSATGGDGGVSYALAPTVPAGLAFDAGSRSVAGTPTHTSARATYEWTATDADGDTATLTFNIEVLPDTMPRFGTGVADQTYRVGSAIDVLRLPWATSGDGSIAYALAPALPSGLTLDAGRGAISGTPSTATTRTTYTWTATDEDGDTATVTFAIEVEPDLMPTFGGASVPDRSYRVSTAIVDFALPGATSGDGELQYALTPALPPGLAFDAATRTVSGTPTAQADRAEYTLTAIDEDGDAATLTFAIEVGMAVTVSIADASGPEGETLSFAVTISDAVAVPVTFAYRTVDGTASAGEDFAAASDSLTFAPGATAVNVDVAVSGDSKAEVDETFMVVLSDLVNAEFNDAQATGTIVDDDVEHARAEALGESLGAFGRTLAAGAVDAVSGRFQEAPSAASGSGYSGGAGIAATVAGFFANDAAHGHGAGRAVVDRLRFAEGASAFDSLDGGRWAQGLPAESFRMSFGGAHGNPGQWTLWGRGATSRVASDAGFAIDGRVNSGYLGVDARLPRNTLVGVAIARSNADFDYQRQGIADGEIELQTTTLLPYVHWARNQLGLWAMAGTGGGEATLTDEFGKTTTDTSLRLMAFGLRRELSRTESLGWALKADAVAARLSADDALGAIAATDANVNRLRLMVEGRREWPQDEQTRLGASFEFGARLDSGDASNGLGAELGGAVDYRNLPLGLGLEARGRYLLAHAESGFEDWGLSAALELDPGARNSGASLRLAPAWGTPESGVAGLWRSDRVLARDLATGRGFRDQRPARLDVEVGYGFSTKRAGPLRFYGVVEASALPGLRLGARTASGSGFGWSIEVDRLQRFAGRADYGILFRVGNTSTPLAALVPSLPSSH